MTEKLSPNFALDEFVTSQSAARLGIDNTPSPEILANLKTSALMMEQVRGLLGKPILITSGYRCPELNRAVGGTARFVNGKEVLSAHTSGQAADFHSPGFGTPRQIAELIVRHLDELPSVDQLIWEFGQWVHLAWDFHPRRDINRVLTIDRQGVRGARNPLDLGNKANLLTAIRTADE